MEADMSIIHQIVFLQRTEQSVLQSQFTNLRVIWYKNKIFPCITTAECSLTLNWTFNEEFRDIGHGLKIEECYIGLPRGIPRFSWGTLDHDMLKPKVHKEKYLMDDKNR